MIDICKISTHPNTQEWQLDFIKKEKSKNYICGAIRKFDSLSSFKINFVKVDYMHKLKIQRENYFSIFAK